MHCTPLRRRWLAGSALAALCACTAPGLELDEGFDRDWSAPGAATCRGGHATFVRRVANGSCGPGGSSTWSGAPARAHGAPSCLRESGCDGDSVAVHRFAEFRPTGDAIGLVNRGVLEIMTTRARQSGARGTLRVDLHVHEDVPVSGGGEHYLVMHNLVLTEAHCPRDCPQVADTATAHGDGAGRYLWYGVIGGAFGEPADAGSPIRSGSVGFAVEVAHALSASGDRPNDLIDASFLPYSVAGKGTAFPAGWYRIAIERTATVYRFSVRRLEEGRFVPIVPDDADRGGTHVRSLPVERLAEPLGRPLPPGYVGLGVAWFGGAARRGAHVDWDDLEVDW